MKKNIAIVKTICAQIKSCFQNNLRSLFSLISGFLIILLVRMFLTITDTIFVHEEYPIQRIIFIFSTTLLMLGLDIGYTKFILKLLDTKTLH